MEEAGDGGFHQRVGTRVNDRSGDVAEKTPGNAAMLSSSGQPPSPRMLGLGFQRWGTSGDAFFGMAETHDQMPAGLYRCGEAPNLGPVLIKQRVETDQLLELPDDAGASIIAEFKTFWTIGDRFRERGFLHKRGFLLWGPPGSGKTSTLQILIKRLIEEQKGVVLLLDYAHLAAACLQMVRKIEPHRPMIAVLEDMEALVRRYGENEYLALLDGEAQVDNIVFLATTNYPELLDKRFTDRPSRFDTIRYIGMPSAAARRLYLSTKEPSLTREELDLWVAVSEGFSVAHLKEMIISVKCLDNSLSDVVKRLEAMRQKPSSEDAPDRVPMGFARLNGAAAH